MQLRETAKTQQRRPAAGRAAAARGRRRGTQTVTPHPASRRKRPAGDAAICNSWGGNGRRREFLEKALACTRASDGRRRTDAYAKAPRTAVCAGRKGRSDGHRREPRAVHIRDEWPQRDPARKRATRREAEATVGRRGQWSPTRTAIAGSRDLQEAARLPRSRGQDRGSDRGRPGADEGLTPLLLINRDSILINRRRVGRGSARARRRPAGRCADGRPRRALSQRRGAGGRRKPYAVLVTSGSRRHATPPGTSQASPRPPGHSSVDGRRKTS